MFAKKNLVAAAALLALAGAAQADVKAYGTLDLSFGSIEAAGGERTTEVRSGSMITSFIGFGGSEDLGGGLKAEFAVETFILADTGSADFGPAVGTQNNLAGGFWGRASWLALSGNFGRALIGQYDNALFTQAWSYSAFGSSFTLSPSTVFSYVDSNLAFDTGWVNSLTYESPNLSGFTFSAQYAAKESSASGAHNSYTVSGAYNAGPLSVMLTYADAGFTDANTAFLADQKVWGLGASYDFGVVKVLGQYTSTDTDGASKKAKAFELGAVVPVTANSSVLVAYGENKDGRNAVGLKHKIFSLAYDYQLSKRTDTYVGFKNDALTGEDSGQSFLVGLRHSF